MIKKEFFNSEYLLLTGGFDYADEFDLPFKIVITTDALIEKLNFIETNKEYWINFEIYFGTNEFLSFSSTKEVINNINFIEISKDDYDVLVKHKFDDCMYNIFDMIASQVEYQKADE